MDREALTRSLLDLLDAEQHSILLYLFDAHPYVDARTFTLARDLRRMAQACRDHQARLLSLLEKLDATVRPQPARRELADYAYVELHAALPILLDERRALAAAYRHAAQQAGGDPALTRPLNEMADHTDQQLATLERHAQRLGPPPTASMDKPLAPGANPAQRI